jgi:hypothetical protein
MMGEERMVYRKESVVYYNVSQHDSERKEAWVGMNRFSEKMTLQRVRTHNFLSLPFPSRHVPVSFGEEPHTVDDAHSCVVPPSVPVEGV